MAKSELVNLQKENAWRSEYYLDYVGTLPSALSGKQTDPHLRLDKRCDVHHIKGHGFGGTVKAPDHMSFPLTRNEHVAGGDNDSFHKLGCKAWEKHHKVNQLRLVFNTLCKAIDDGVLVVDEERAKELSKQHFEANK